MQTFMKMPLATVLCVLLLLLTGARGSQGPPGPKGAPGSFGRNWKQCVFKNLNDPRDYGLIKVTTELDVQDYINEFEAN